MLDLDPCPATDPRLTLPRGVSPGHPARAYPGEAPDNPRGDQERSLVGTSAGLRWWEVVLLAVAALALAAGAITAMAGDGQAWVPVALAFGTAALLLALAARPGRRCRRSI